MCQHTRVTTIMLGMCHYLSHICFLMSLNLQVALSADRYWAVCHPLSYHKNKELGHKKWIIIVCVIAAIIGGNALGYAWFSDTIQVALFLYICLVLTSSFAVAICIINVLIDRSIRDQVS